MGSVFGEPYRSEAIEGDAKLRTDWTVYFQEAPSLLSRMSRIAGMPSCGGGTGRPCHHCVGLCCTYGFRCRGLSVSAAKKESLAVESDLS